MCQIVSDKSWMQKPAKQYSLGTLPKLYDLQKKKFIVSRNVCFFEERFDHFDDEVKPVPADLASIFPDADEGQMYLGRC